MIRPLYAAVLLACGIGQTGLVGADPLPVPCAPCNVGAGSFNWKLPSSGSSYVPGPAGAVINQQLQRETFNWQSFDIAPGKTVEFRQPDASSVALNRIHQGSPSQIFGVLKANGQVYLINQNGIVFRPGATVDVNTLVASGVDLNADVADLIERVGITNVLRQAGFPAFKAAAGTTPGDVTVEQGATIKAQTNGRVLLAGGHVVNAGRIDVSGPGGQAILVASKDQIYVFLPNDPAARGLAVEIGEGGTVENLGSIVAEKGTVTLAGLAVNQRGIVRATSAVDYNGVIRLQARDGARTLNAAREPLPQRAGRVTVGAGSRTEAVLVAGDTGVAPDAAPLAKPTINIAAQDIVVESGATLRATGGRIELEADSIPDSNSVGNAGRISIGAGAVIDASGARGVKVPVARNFVTVEVRRNELADSPAQRGGPLFGKKVSFDIRKPLPRIANVEAGLATVQRSGAERLTPGGVVSLRAVSQVEVAPGARIDVSGGDLDVQGGQVSSTKLLFQGRVVDISDADPQIRYDGVLGELEYEHPKWGRNTTEFFQMLGPAMSRPAARFEPGYVEAKDAGSIIIAAERANVLGTLLADAQRGPYQRLAPGTTAGFLRPTNEVPLSGLLDLTTLGSLELAADGRFPFTRSGLNRLRLSVDDFVLADGAALDLGRGGELTVKASGSIELAGRVSAPGGKLSFATGPTDVNDQSDVPRHIDVQAGSLLDVRGEWINDARGDRSLRAASPLFVDGGSIVLDSTGDLRVAADTILRVGGGAQVDASGVQHPGRGGSLRLSAHLNRNFINRSPVVELAGVWDGLTFANSPGASALTVDVPELVIGAGAAGSRTGTVVLSPEFAADSGFSVLNLKANERGFRLLPDTRFELSARNLVPVTGRTGGLPASGTPLEQFAEATLLSAFQRQPTRVNITVAPSQTLGGDFDPQQMSVFERGSEIRTDAGGSIAISSQYPIRIAGDLVAPGGAIDLTMKPIGGVAPHDPTRAIWLMPDAVLDVAGVALQAPSATPGRLGDVRAFDGGRITLKGEEAYVVGLPGARMSVAGTTFARDLLASDPLGRGRYTRVSYGTDAGTITANSSNGIFLYSAIDGHAEAALGANSGTLALTLDGDLRRNNGATLVGAARFPETPLRVQLGATSLPSNGVVAGTRVDDTLFGLASFDRTGFERGGFGSLKLKASPHQLQRALNNSAGDPLMVARIDLVGNFVFDVADTLVFDAPVLQSDGGNARLSAGYFALGFTVNEFVTADTNLPNAETDPPVKVFTPTAGTGRLRVDADFVDLVGFAALRGFGGGSGADVSLLSSGDLRLRGTRTPANVTRQIEGALTVNADLVLGGARIYPSTLTNFEILNSKSDGLVSFTGGGNETLPLSAGGSLLVQSARIVQDGSLLAPFGSIDFRAGSLLTLGSNSLTSVTGQGLTSLFGRTEIGEWVYPFRDGRPNTRVFEASVRSGISELPPEKRISLSATGLDGNGQVAGRVVLSPGSRIDVRRGGALLASEFLPGPLGSSDLLVNDAGDGSFALLPALGAGIAPFDPVESLGFGPSIGTTLHVARAGASGLAPGAYTVLPARYALLPGALLVRPVEQISALAAPLTDVTTNDGLPVIAGDFARFGDSTFPSLPSATFEVLDANALAQRAEYRLSSADTFFAEQARVAGIAAPLLPRDAGALVLSANLDIDLGGSIVRDLLSTGRGSRVDISASRLLLSDDPAPTPGIVKLGAAQLSAFGAESLLLGGVRTLSGGITTISRVDASEVVVDADAQVSAPELMFVASNRVQLGARSQVRASGPANDQRQLISLSGDNAFVMASTARLPQVRRSGTGAAARAIIDAGANLFGAGSIVLDSTGDVTLAGDVAVGSGGGARFGASTIALGQAPGGTNALVLSAADLTALAASELELVSRNALRVFGDFTLGFEALTLDAPGMRGEPGIGSLSLTGDALTIANSRGLTLNAGANGSGTLNVNVATLTLAPTAGLLSTGAEDGDFDLVGFDTVRLTSPRIVASGAHTLDLVASDTILRGDTLGALRGGELSLRASGALQYLPLAAGTTPPDATDFLGGRVRLTAASLTADGLVLAPSGSIRLVATTGDLRIGGAAALLADGLSGLDLRQLTTATPGGVVELAAQAGSLSIADGARVRVDGGIAPGTARSGGSLLMSAPTGSVTVAAGTLLSGTTGRGAEGASIAVDTGNLNGGGSLSALNTLTNAGGFSGSRQVRLRGAGQTLTVDAADVVTAARIRLSSDNGGVTIAGTLDASGERAGSIDIDAAGRLTLSSSARLLAISTGGERDPLGGGSFVGGQRGGRVDVTGLGGATFEAGSLIDVTGTRATNGALVAEDSGRIAFGLQRVGVAGVDAGPIDTTLLGAGDVVVLARKRYTPAQLNTVLGDSSNFTGGEAGLLADLGLDDVAVARAAPWVEVTTPGNLTIASITAPLNYASLFNAGNVNAGVLSLRVAGDLSVNGDLRDGTTTDDFGRLVADSAHSWTMEFVAGADLTAADSLAVVAGPRTLAFGNNVDVSTGSGDLRLASGGDVTLGTNASLQAIGRHLDPLGYRGTILSDGDVGYSFNEQFLNGTSFPEAGGDISITAVGNVNSARARGFVNEWMRRVGGANFDFGNTPQAWGIVLEDFNGNVASFGGGDVTVRAGGSIVSGQYSLTTSGRQEGQHSFDINTGIWTVERDVVRELGSGRLVLVAGNDMNGVDAAVTRGSLLAQAGRDFVRSGVSNAPRLLIGDADFRIEAGRNIEIGAVIDPGALVPVNNLLSDLQPSGGNWLTFYLAQGERSGLELASSTGQVSLLNQDRSASGLRPAGSDLLLNLYPANLRAVAPFGDIRLSNGMRLFPRAGSSVLLAAGGAVTGVVGTNPQLLQSDSDPASLPNRRTPLAAPGLDTVLSELTALFTVSTKDRVRTVDHATSPIHAGDVEPNIVVARDGDIRTVELLFAKRSVFDAGRDIANISAVVQHTDASDASVFSAGRAIRMDALREPNRGRILPANLGFGLGGPGRYQFLAGGDIDLGTSDGIRSTGNIFNPALADKGADLTLLPGLGAAPAWDAFLDAYVAPAGSPFRGRLATFLATLPTSLAGPPGDDVARLRQLPQPFRTDFLLDVLFQTLEDVGTAASDPKSPAFQDFAPGYAALDVLFPPSSRFAGNLSTPLSTVQIQDGGDLKLVVPGGSADAGLTAAVGVSVDKDDKDLGYIVFRDGSVRGYVRDDFNVNSTRVFAQRGGDILLWSANGDIDAGRGAKTAASIEPQAPIFDEFGNFVDELPLTVIGSGIRNFAPPGVPPGSLFLFAPRGIINAGDAGIGSAGNVVLGATQVVGAENIDVGGVAVGVPTADAGGLAAGLTGVGDVAASASKATEKATAAAAAAEAAAAADSSNRPQMSIISVKVLGFGA